MAVILDEICTRLARNTYHMRMASAFVLQLHQLVDVVIVFFRASLDIID